MPNDDYILGSMTMPPQPAFSVNVSSKGWECPKCRAIMSPASPTCFFCKPTNENLNIGDQQCLLG